MNTNKRNANLEATPLTPDPQNSWLKTRPNAHRTRNSIPDPPASPSPQPRTIGRSTGMSPGWTSLGDVARTKKSNPGEYTHGSSSFLLGGIVHASGPLGGEEINGSGHGCFGDITQPNDLIAGEDMADLDIHLGDAKKRADVISTTHDATPFTYSVSAVPPFQSLPLEQVHQTFDITSDYSATMVKRKRDPSPGCIWPQTMEDAFTRATPVFSHRNNAMNQESSPTQYTFETQTLHNAVDRPTLETQTSQGPDPDSDAGLILQQPFDTPVLAPAKNTGRTPGVRTSLPRQTASTTGRTPEFEKSVPQQTAVSAGRPPGALKIPRKLPTLAPRPEPTLSSLPDLHRSLRVGDRVHLLNEHGSDSGDAIWQITGLTQQGTFEITPIAETLECPQIERLVRAPLTIGDIVSVFQHTLETGVDGTQVFGRVKIGFGAVSKCYVVDGRRKYDVRSEDPVYLGMVYEGLDDTEIGMYDLAVDQMGATGGGGGLFPVGNHPFVGRRVVGDFPVGRNAQFGDAAVGEHGQDAGAFLPGGRYPDGYTPDGYAPVGKPLPDDSDFGNLHFSNEQVGDYQVGEPSFGQPPIGYPQFGPPCE